MNEEIFNLIKTQGKLILELRAGLATIFNLCTKSGVFTESQFRQEFEKVMTSPDFQVAQKALDELGSSISDEELQDFLRKYKGTIQ